MTIPDLKSRLDIIEIAQKLGIMIGKGEKAKCPFHADKTPSLQFSSKKQIATCFSSNCNAGTMDVVNLTEKKLNLNTHEAINWLKEQIGIYQLPQESQIAESKITELERIEILTNLFEKFERAFLASKPAKDYVTSRNLNHKILNVGYNSGTFHHAVNLKSNREATLKKYVQLGLLKEHQNGYNVFGKGCLVFPLRNHKGQIVSFYFRSIAKESSSPSGRNEVGNHYYLKDRQGLYPINIKAETRKLVLTESIIDAETLNQNVKKYGFLPLYGTNGLTKWHIEAISQLKNLEEIILFFDGDTPGIKATDIIANNLRLVYPKATIKIVQTPKDEDVNSLLEGHDPKILEELIKDAQRFNTSESKVESLDTPSKKVNEQSEQKKHNTSDLIPSTVTALQTQNPNNIIYITEIAKYQIKGGIRKDLDSLKVTLVISPSGGSRGKSRTKLDLYEDKQAEKVARTSADKLGLRADLIERDLSILTDLLDEYRESVAPIGDIEKQKVMISKEEKDKCIAFLKKPNLLQNINELIGKSGVVGEEKNRLFLFGIASTYKMENTLHALIQGTSGSGKTHLLATIMDFMPPEDTINLTRVTESSFYNYGEYELSNKLIGMEDFDGLEEKAELAFRELMSKGMISSSTSGKNEHTGQITAYIKTVYGPIASLSATTRGEIYEDNMSRSFLISVDESEEQTAKIIKYQNKRSAGRIDKKEEVEIREFLRNCMRLLSPIDVINPFADKIDLPKEAHKIRRLNDLFQSYVKQITLLNQYQRSRASTGELLTDKEDLKTAIEIMFDSIILKVDELDGSLRGFYERLKTYVLRKGKEYEFEQREIRQDFRISKTQMHRNINSLLELEYISKTYVGSRNTYHYKIAYWDNMQAVRDRIKKDLNTQLDSL